MPRRTGLQYIWPYSDERPCLGSVHILESRKDLKSILGMEKGEGQRVLTDSNYNAYRGCMRDRKGIVNDVECSPQ